MPEHDQITLIKDFTYRGSKEEWSNSYSLTGTTPTTDAGWKALADAIMASEKTCYDLNTRLVRASGHRADESFAAWSYDYLGAVATVAGTLAGGATGVSWAGDQAGWLRMRVGSTASGKPKYVRKYFHGGFSTEASKDAVLPAMVTAYLAHGNKMVDGTLPGGMKWCGPGGTIGTAPGASPFVTTRTLKRRGRRPTPSP